MDEGEQIRVVPDGDTRQRLHRLAQAYGIPEAELLRRAVETGIAMLLTHTSIRVPDGVPGDHADLLATTLDALAHFHAQRPLLSHRYATYRARMDTLEDAVDPLSREAHALQEALRHCQEDLDEHTHV